MKVKIEQRSNFNVGNDSRLFFDVLEAKKVSERTVSSMNLAVSRVARWREF